MLTTAIAPPKTYSEWVAVLDMLKAKSDDEAVLTSCFLSICLLPMNVVTFFRCICVNI